ncbi:type-F conjugative transfer system pilin assembly thiol-disulfide isomerase TrbB [Providencia rettgeri]|uniref:type-F conjugative transfer system pilin assembly thiol-disulfide isomerase TrbB n=1 Tax=Providencia rettgeri TaxID=587 RepID=UPI00141A2862|nr:type-F conjugative transfer system pilin assembly thiol-disulfide isomerase TrbB [Providencia rettgeri]NIH07023.1 type-F conjugative transfer system pilin assembly thiol-disulfide isomerase TrbB [Providencia rettgeri]
MLAIMLFFSGLVQASVMDDIAELEAHKTVPTKREAVIEEETPPSKINTVAVKPYRLPNGKVVNLNDYTLVLFMQAKCPYCQQFDPQLALLSAQTGFKVFAYTLDGQGDMAFPNAIPAPAEVVQTFFGAGMQVVTPSVFLVEVNTLRTYPLLQGMTDMNDVMNRIHSNLMVATQ